MLLGYVLLGDVLLGDVPLGDVLLGDVPLARLYVGGVYGVVCMVVCMVVCCGMKKVFVCTINIRCVRYFYVFHKINFRLNN